ncbi:helix-turn-helix transcriptional regulator [Rhizobium skierniewicense]|uniref:AraC family transcriptional regulator n=1 Tax=Rhizobium TaxID=379 RepID=UPI001787657E|nr:MULTISPECIES: AraC family transcriptional regulator [Rhizobium]MBD8688905.1 helix-turn-helix transcriptional regulator [Rhizobium sp. CFBP 13644]MBD8694124.1 helix-turn-helix transcriptional regulator [Rhizobium sp. CFBP 13717]MCI9868431.1 helix-turn-helix transcriptional regulator [Rhizobium skierniewicense]
MQNSKCQIQFVECASDNPKIVNSTVPKISTAAIYSALEPEAPFQMAIRHAFVGEIGVSESSSSTGYLMASEVTQHPRIELHFVEQGRCFSRTNNSVIDASAGTAYLLRDTIKHDMMSEPGTSQICVTMPSARYMRLYASMSGDPLQDIPNMHCMASSSESKLQCLKEVAKLLISVSSNERASGGKSLGPCVLSEAIYAMFIESWPRRDGHRNNQVARPFYVKRAIEYMHSNATQKVNLENLAAASGVSVRTLQLGFRNFVGLSPMGYLLKFRLECAYNDLLAGADTLTIDDIARRWGFTNPGKFSAQIRQKYGRNPLAIRKAQRWEASEQNIDKLTPLK